MTKQQTDIATRLKKAAKPDCSDCSGSGLYGKHCICLCVNAGYHEKKSADALEAAERRANGLELALAKIARWDASFPEKDKRYGAMAVVTAREAVSQFRATTLLIRHATGQQQGGDDE